MYENDKNSDIKTIVDVLNYFGMKFKKSDKWTTTETTLYKYINLLNSPLFRHIGRLCESVNTIQSIVKKSKHVCSLDSTITPPKPLDFTFNDQGCIIYGESYLSFINKTDLNPNSANITNTCVVSESTPVNTALTCVETSGDVPIAKDWFVFSQRNPDSVKETYANELNVDKEMIQIVHVFLSKPFPDVIDIISKGMRNSHHLFVVSNVKDKDSEVSALILKDDVVLEVNEIPLYFASLQQVKNILKTVYGDVKVILFRDICDKNRGKTKKIESMRLESFSSTSSIDFGSIDRLDSFEQQDTIEERMNQLLKNCPLPKQSIVSHIHKRISSSEKIVGEKYEVCLKSGPNGYGLNIANGRNENRDRVYVRNVKNKSPAHKNGLIKDMDEILVVNGVSVKGMHHGEVSKLMMKLGEREIVLIMRRKVEEKRGDCKSLELNDFPRSVSLSGAITRGSIGIEEVGRRGKGVDVRVWKSVELKRCKRDGFGFNFVGGMNKNKTFPFYVQSVCIGGPAMKSMKIKCGDKIMSLNGINLMGLTHQQVLTIIQSSTDTLHIVIEPK